MQKFFKIKDNTQIYIIAPAGVVTGGVELLHQLCDVLTSNGQSSYIVYIGRNKHETPKDYIKYKIKHIEYDSIVDSEENILIIPETELKYLNNFSNIKSLIWWMSVDNYYLSNQGNVFETFKYQYLKCGLISGIKSVVKKILLPKLYPTYSISKLRNNKNIVCHAYQSEYAANFLRNKNIENITHLSDYINVDYEYNSSVLSEKENIIIYNPKKGGKFTHKLISASPELNWQPIENMSRAEVKKLMLRAKIYVDFGHHPGKDRMPREAAMSGCCIITGRLGAAGFLSDLPIDEKEFKFDQKKENIEIIINKLHSVLDNFENEINKFSNYRQMITEEKSIFEKDVISLLTNNTNISDDNNNIKNYDK